MEEQKPNEEKKNGEGQDPGDGQETTSRRKFLEIATLSIGGVIGLSVALPAVSYVVGPSLAKTNAQEWMRVGAASKVEVGVPTLFKVKIKRQIGWNVTEDELALYVVTENGHDFLAISNTCTHLGCRVRWIAEKGQFLCPCHNAVFDKNGKVVAGPPPKPLNQYQVKLENDQLFILGG